MLSSSKGFLPYSTSFLQELDSSNGPLEQADATDDPVTPSSSSSKKQKRKSSGNVIKIVSSLDCTSCASSSFKSVVLSEDGLSYAIATTDNNAALFFTGFGTITLLKGSMNINGYDVDIGKEVNINRSSWLPAIRIWCNDTPIHSYQTVDGACYQTKKAGPVKLSTLSKPAKEKLNALNLSGIKCCFVVQGLKHEEQEWMVRIEDKALFSLPSTTPVSSPSSTWSCSEVVSCSSGLLGISSYFASIHADTMGLHPSWVSAADNIAIDNTVARCQNSCMYGRAPSSGKWKNNQFNNPQDGSNTPIISMVCGAKGAGKSSYMKYLVNRLLSYSKTIVGSELAQVCVIDCDLGQPELTMPGMISLNVVTSPLLSSSHLHLQAPAASVFLGDITSRYEPEAFCAALKQLQQHYLMLQDSYKHHIQEHYESKPFVPSSSSHKSGKSQILPSSTSLGSNMFSLLLNEEDQSSKLTSTTAAKQLAATNQKVNIIGESSIDPTWRIPLIINTDGNVQYMGAEILSAITDIFQPSHIVHITSLRSRPLPIFDVLRRRANQMSNQTDGTIVSCRFLNVERGREGPSKVSPIDLRNIRMISYFLRNANIKLPSNIAPKVRKIENNSSSTALPVMSSIAVELDEMRDEDDEPLPVNEDDNRGRDLDALYIKNAKFVGAEQCGALVFGMLEQATGNHYIIPFDRIVFNDKRDELSSSSSSSYNVLAAINGELVGVSNFNENSFDSVSIDSITMHSKLVDNVDYKFQLHSFQRFQVIDCLGIVLVRAIDICRRCVVIFVPPTVNLSTCSRFVITPGVNLTLPNAAYVGSGFPVYPYLTSELFGEGSAQSKIRSSVKRKVGSAN